MFPQITISLSVDEGKIVAYCYGINIPRVEGEDICGVLKKVSTSLEDAYIRGYREDNDRGESWDALKSIVEINGRDMRGEIKKRRSLCIAGVAYKVMSAATKYKEQVSESRKAKS